MAAGGHHTADKIGLNRQLPVAAIHHGQQFHAGGTAPGVQSLQGRAHGAASEDHVIDQNHFTTFHRNRQRRGLG